MPPRQTPPAGPPRGAGLGDYVKEAFLFRWNLLFFLGSTAAAAMTPFAPVLLPLVAAGELTYLTGLISIPRFRAAIDAKIHAAGDAGAGAEEIRTPSLDRLLWLFLRLLLSKAALDRFLASMDEAQIGTRLTDLRKSLETAKTGGDERIVRSLQDSLASTELRLDNYTRAKKNAEFVSIELDRIEGKIQTLAEMAVNRQDPDFLSSQVDSAADSMRQTEKAVSELQHLTGLADELEEPPAILETDLRQVIPHDA
jgi:hypothetical protein